MLRESQGIEHGHKLRKRWGCESSNRKKGQRTGTLLAHGTVLDYVAKEQNEHQFATEHEKKKCRKIKRMYAKIERMKKKHVINEKLLKQLA